MSTSCSYAEGCSAVAEKICAHCGLSFCKKHVVRVTKDTRLEFEWVCGPCFRRSTERIQRGVFVTAVVFALAMLALSLTPLLGPVPPVVRFVELALAGGSGLLLLLIGPIWLLRRMLYQQGFAG